MNIIVLLMCTKTPFIASTDPNHNTSSWIEPASPKTDEDPETLFAEDGVVAEKPGAVDQRESKCRIIPSRTWISFKILKWQISNEALYFSLVASL